MINYPRAKGLPDIKRKDKAATSMLSSWVTLADSSFILGARLLWSESKTHVGQSPLRKKAMRGTGALNEDLDDLLTGAWSPTMGLWWECNAVDPQASPSAEGSEKTKEAVSIAAESAERSSALIMCLKKGARLQLSATMAPVVINTGALGRGQL